MKKLLVLLFAILLLAGCSSSKTENYLSYGNEPLFKGPGHIYTNNDLYKSLKVTSEAVIENDIIATIAKTYEIDVEAIEEEADEMINQYLEIGYEPMIVQYYGSIDAYRSNIITSHIMDALAIEMLKENFDEAVESDVPIQMQVAKFDSEEDAKALIEKINAGSTFDMALLEIIEYANPAPVIYLDSSTDYDIQVKEYLNTTDSTGLSPVITASKTSKNENGEEVMEGVYYVINVLSRNVEDFKDAYLEAASLNLEVDDITAYFFNKHSIKFYDQDLYEMMTKNYEVLK